MKEWRGRIQRKLGAILLLSFMCNSFMKVEAFKRPHIVFVLADDLGYNDVGYHGKTEIKTPCIDRLALEGIRLENYYVQPKCTPSRSQLMSGRYQIHTGLQHGVISRMQPNALPLDNIILPQQLKRCGYSTYMVGKWHLGFYKKEFLPWNRGFDRFLGILTGAADYFTREAKQGIDFHDSEIGPIKKYVGNYSTELYTDKANEFIKNHNKKRPMFLYLSHQAVHWPMQKPLRVSNDYSHIKDEVRRNYAHMTSSLDSSVCSVVKQLKREKMWKNTIFIFSTDNGGETILGGSNWPLRGAKRSFFEGGIRGVGFIAGKAIPRKKAINRELFHVSDWMPTLMQGARCSLHPKTLPLDGINQWQSLKHNLPSKRKEILHNIDPLLRLKKGTKRGEKEKSKTRKGQRKGGRNGKKILKNKADTNVENSKAVKKKGLDQKSNPKKKIKNKTRNKKTKTTLQKSEEKPKTKKLKTAKGKRKGGRIKETGNLKAKLDENVVKPKSMEKKEFEQESKNRKKSKNRMRNKMNITLEKVDPKSKTRKGPRKGKTNFKSKANTNAAKLKSVKKNQLEQESKNKKNSKKLKRSKNNKSVKKFSTKSKKDVKREKGKVNQINKTKTKKSKTVFETTSRTKNGKKTQQQSVSKAKKHEKSYSTPKARERKNLENETKKQKRNPNTKEKKEVVNGTNNEKRKRKNTKNKKLQGKLRKHKKSHKKKGRKTIYFGFDVTVTAAIRNGPWKLLTGKPGRGDWIEPPEYSGKVFHSNWTGGYELFNIDKDPFETTNVAPEHPKIVKFLLQRLAKYNETAVPVMYPNDDEKADSKYHNGFWVPWVT